MIVGDFLILCKFSSEFNENDQPMTQNMTFEIYCDSKEELEKYAKYKCEIESFVATETATIYLLLY